jgi:hypothetical protein
MSSEIIPAEQITIRIRHFPGEKGLLAFNVAAFYGAEARRLNHAIERNANPTSGDFVFRLSAAAVGRVSQFVISQIRRGERKPNPNSSLSVMSSRKHCGKRCCSYSSSEQRAPMVWSRSNNITVQNTGLVV